MSNPYYQRQFGGQMGMDMGPMGDDIFLINDIIEAIIAEVHAYNFYELLARMADNEQDRQIILRIQSDEARHYRWFTMILQRLGGQLPQIPAGRLPSNFEDGVREAIITELNAASFYQDIVYRAISHMVQMHFMHASQDEQRHASLFQYMLTNINNMS